MKVFFASLLVLTVAPTAAVFHPTKVSYASLLDPALAEPSLDQWVDALSETGMISITGIPHYAKEREVLSHLTACADESGATQEHEFPDGTRRRTLATRSVPGGIQTINHHSLSEGQLRDNDEQGACRAFDKAAAAFRSTVAIVTQAFADRVQESFFAMSEALATKPLLSTRNGMTFDTFSDVVENGEHLEHFHVYDKEPNDADDDETIELHTDQGLFIVFTPGLLIGLQQSSARKSSGFFIKLADGSVEEVEFGQEDELVIMLGDGVNQYINDHVNTVDGKQALRAVPHMLRMESTQAESRVWYGRMVLPPVDAIHPGHDDSMTFGEIRNKMIESSIEGQEGFYNHLGCSGGLVARDLAAVTCESDSLYCWHRCMNYTDTVNDDACASEGRSVQCINPRLQISTGESHGDYFLACALETDPIETPFPTLPEYPREEEECTEAGFDAFAPSTDYDFSVDLPVGGRLSWNIVGDAVQGRIAYNGLFGWLSFGFASLDDSILNGMLGANVLLALPGTNYSAQFGLDLDGEPNVNEYEISSSQSAFRHWSTPIATSRISSVPNEIKSTECYTSFTFEQTSIGKYTFNVNGTDELVWAANGKDFFVNYHDTRARFTIDWAAGEASFDGDGVGHSSDDDHDDATEEPDSGSPAIVGHLVTAAFALAAAMLV